MKSKKEPKKGASKSVIRRHAKSEGESMAEEMREMRAKKGKK